MQKKLIALAVAGLVSAPVFAQSNVTVYGIADAFFGYGKMDDNKFTGVESGGWAGFRLGFKGSEDLGNGLKAVFTLEYGIELDDNEGVGSGASRSRQQFVGLQGGFGFLGLGRQYSPGYYVLKYDAINVVPFSPQFILANALGSNIVAASPARLSNSINYKSPDFGGLTLNAIYGFNEENQDNNRQAGDTAAIGAEYANGPLAVGLVYSQVKQDAGAIASEKFNGVADDTKKEAYLGAAYDFGMFKLMGSYQVIKDATDREDSDKVWQVGGIVPVSSAGKVHLSYGRTDADRDDSDAAAWSLLYSHSLSKRTTAYMGYTQVDNDDATNISVLAKRTDETTGAALFDEESRNFLIGLNHSF
ncbi:porin [Aromatoleum bremense]|uniref:Porin n=1 Tax=Aromatoleum bremense TaxID=76115 RepID=A0ABX1NRK8_9RHOO|nr:porin [Aromatoleum bremense]NMG14528.1 porin [Aromatoleum bremense]QTQ32773.1 Gram-negative outer membrane porin protein [Aromatoleum bremense]